ncbi:hypothetical protein [Aporhodopirellula aestuarii]|uniref:Nucleotidyl transferase AbiEii/AbiGii toxin family protein n=1 Tax=Aporhodopirellula aestuarii TaxID=2950107 RepID=A0ABT0U2Q9_9BACT|nr:hypothetical protein [Aporhodopirellula aestuarii]MCM2371088.1 hypothetical protein [Aporhodopirellula aestuarii]
MAFRTHFADFTDHYVMIGGPDCSIAMESVGIQFRSTKDLDIVLCVETLDVPFTEAFWQFVRDGGYEIHEKATGEKQFYRFKKPKADDFPFMLELLCRSPELLEPIGESHLTPIPMDDSVSSLSAILLDETYYGFLISGKQLLDWVSIVGPGYLIPLKARAWLDLTDRKTSGESVDSRDIKKHKLDVFRLLTIVDPGFNSVIPDSVGTDLAQFLDRMSDEAIDMKAVGLGQRKKEDAVNELRRIYQLVSFIE